jgi:hypothetical protein
LLGNLKGQSKIKEKIEKNVEVLRFMSSLGPGQIYRFQADIIWWEGLFRRREIHFYMLHTVYF